MSGCCCWLSSQVLVVLAVLVAVLSGQRPASTQCDTFLEVVEEVSFTWRIHNFPYRWEQDGLYLSSHLFPRDTNATSGWMLDLYPRGHRNEDGEFVALALCLVATAGPREMARYRLSLLNASRDRVYSVDSDSPQEFPLWKCRVVDRFISRSDLVANHLLPPSQTLSILAEVWRMGETTRCGVGAPPPEASAADSPFSAMSSLFQQMQAGPLSGLDVAMQMPPPAGSPPTPNMPNSPLSLRAPPLPPLSLS